MEKKNYLHIKNPQLMKPGGFHANYTEKRTLNDPHFLLSLDLWYNLVGPSGAVLPH